MSTETYVLLRLGEETYGVHVRFVVSILPMQECTHVPGAPDFIEGVINMRGVVVRSSICVVAWDCCKTPRHSAP